VTANHRPRRITVVQLARFGDVIQTSPLLHSLRRSREPCEITLVVDARSAPAAHLLAGVDRVLEIDLEAAARVARTPGLQAMQALRRWVDSWRPEEPADLLLLLNLGTLPASIGALLPAGEVHGPRMGVPLPGPHRLLQAALRDRLYDPLHLSEIWAAYAPPAWPLREPELKRGVLGTRIALLGLEESPKVRIDNRFALNVGAGAAGRRLGEEKLADLAVALLRGGAGEVVLLGGRVDRETGEAVCGAIPAGLRPRVRNLVGKTLLEELPALLARCAVLISSDTGTLQLAAATSAIPLGLFFGGANPHETGPYSSRAIALVDRETLQAAEEDATEQAASRFDMEQVARVALAAAKGNRDWRTGDETASVHLLVARPGPVGLEYRSAAAGGCDPLAQGRRWRPLLRRLLWGVRPPGGAAPWEMDGRQGENAGGDESRVLNRLLTGGKALAGEFGREERWLAGILNSFPEEVEEVREWFLAAAGEPTSREVLA